MTAGKDPQTKEGHVPKVFSLIAAVVLGFAVSTLVFATPPSAGGLSAQERATVVKTNWGSTLPNGNNEEIQAGEVGFIVAVCRLGNAPEAALRTATTGNATITTWAAFLEISGIGDECAKELYQDGFNLD